MAFVERGVNFEPLGGRGVDDELDHDLVGGDGTATLNSSPVSLANFTSSTFHGDPEFALHWVEQLGADLQDSDYPAEAGSLGLTLIRWKHQVAAWHETQASNGPTEAANNLINLVMRAAFGFTSFRNYRIRPLLNAGKPNWDLLATITPR